MEKRKKEDLNKELKKGEKSGFVKKFDRDSFIKSLHKKMLNPKIIELSNQII